MLLKQQPPAVLLAQMGQGGEAAGTHGQWEKNQAEAPCLIRAATVRERLRGRLLTRAAQYQET